MLIYDLRTEYLENPVGLDQARPRFSWKLSSSLLNVVQISWRILAEDAEDPDRILWDSKEVLSSKTSAVVWEGQPLTSRQRVSWTVTAKIQGTDPKDRQVTEEEVTSGPCCFEMGFLSPADWTASWIEPERDVDPDKSKPARLLRKEFTVGPGLTKARLYQTAHGLYETWLNGRASTEDKFKPGFTSYRKRLQYHVSDVTSLLSEGANCWAVELGDGWWRGTTGGQMTNTFGYKLAYLGQLELSYADGHKEWIGTDDSFRVGTGGLLASDMLFGDVYDASLEPEGWKAAGFDDSSWQISLLMADQAKEKAPLTATRGVPVREMEVFSPEILQTPDGSTVLDFGQNIAGYVRMTLRGCHKGQTISLLHGETLDHEGNFTQKNYAQTENTQRGATQKVTYLASGKAVESYCPLFSIFGFRYVKLCGLEGQIRPEDFQAIAVYSKMKETGSFTCSNPLIDQLVRNSLWSQKGNFMDVPTDCPTRERNPYTGDAQIYASTAADFMDVYSFFEKWMLDYTAEQFASGKIPNTVPSISALNHNDEEQARRDKAFEMMEDGPMKQMALAMQSTKENGNFIDGSSGWGDAVTIIPYTMFLKYADPAIYRKQFETCRRWVDYIRRDAARPNPLYAGLPYYKDEEDAVFVWDNGFHWGEWLEADVDIYSDMYSYIGYLMTYPDYLSATMFYYYSAKIVSEMAAVLGLEEEEKTYGSLAANVKRVYNKYFIPASGIIKEGRQALHVRALAFGLVEDEKKKAVSDYLLQLVKDKDYTLNTGFLSTPYLLPVLTECGHKDAAYRLLEKESSPSWLAPVKAGATAIPESWNGYETCSSSLNHYAYGAVCDFLFRYTAGIRPLRQYPGYSEFELRPIIGGSLTHAKAVYDSIHGPIVSAWKRLEDRICYSFEVPANTKARISVSGSFSDYETIRTQYPESSWQENTIQIAVGSGSWTLEIK